MARLELHTKASGNDKTIYISYDYTLDNILSVKVPIGTDPDDSHVHEMLRDKLITLIQDKCECFMFEGTFEESE